MHTEILNFIGYDSIDTKRNKENFTKFLKRQNIPYEELIHADDRCKLYVDIVEEQRTMKLNSLAKRKWLVINSRDFKRAVMDLRTKRAEVNHFWQIVAKNLSPHMGAEILQFIGYDSINTKQNKQNFTSFLKRQNIQYE